MSQDDTEYNWKRGIIIEELGNKINKAMQSVGHKDLPDDYLDRFFTIKKTNKKKGKLMLKQICRWMYKQKLMDAPNKVAYLTFGRWQPPHIGHKNLIDFAMNMANDNHAHVYVVVTEKGTINSNYYNDKPDLKIEYELKNPLTLQQKINYLNKMFSPTLKWNYSTSVPSPILFYYPSNFAFMYQGTRNDNIDNTFSRFVRYRKRNLGAGSTGILSKLKEMGYSKFAIIVGSDRIELFKRTNPGIKIIQHGLDRASSGKGEILNDITSSKELNLSFLEENFNTQNYSGSKLRYAARNKYGNQQINSGTVNNYKYFTHATKFGRMKNRDVDTLIKDITNATPLTDAQKRENQEIFLNTNEMGSRIRLLLAKTRKNGGRKKKNKTRKKKKRKTRKKRR